MGSIKPFALFFSKYCNFDLVNRCVLTVLKTLLEDAVKRVIYNMVKLIQKLVIPLGIGCFFFPILQAQESLLSPNERVEHIPITGVDSIPQGVHLTIGQAIEAALAQNSSIMIQDVAFVKQQYMSKSQWAALFPSIDVSGTYGYTLKKQRMYLDGFPGAGAMPGVEDGIEIGRTHNIQAGVRVGMPLINFQLWEGLALSREQVELSWTQAQNSRSDLVAEVRKAFLSALLAKESVSVLEEAYQNARRNYQSVQDKFSQGLVAQYDLLRAEVGVSNLEPNLLQAQVTMKLAHKQLYLLMGIDLNSNLTLTGDLKALTQELNMNARSSDAVDNNPTLRLMKHQLRMLNRSVTAARYAYIPTLSLGGNYTFNFSSNRFDLDNKKLWVPFSVVNLSLSVPIFSGGSRYYNARSTKGELLMQQLRLNDTQKQINLAVERQQEQIRTSLKKIEVTQRAVVAAQKGLAIASKRYDTGMGTQLELDDARMQLLQAQLNHKQAQHELLVADTELSKLIGSYNGHRSSQDSADRIQKIRQKTSFF